MTLKEAQLRIEELERENASLKAELAKFEGKKPAGRRVHNEKWTENYDMFVSLFEKGHTMIEITDMTGFSRRTCYRYKEYYDRLKACKDASAWDKK